MRPVAAVLFILCVGCTREPAQAATSTVASRSIVADLIVSVTNATSRSQHIALAVGPSELALGDVEGHASRSFSVPSAGGDSTVLLFMTARARPADDPTRSAGFHLVFGQRAVWILSANGRGALTIR